MAAEMVVEETEEVEGAIRRFCSPIRRFRTPRAGTPPWQSYRGYRSLGLDVYQFDPLRLAFYRSLDDIAHPGYVVLAFDNARL